MDDSQGYARLTRSLEFLRSELTRLDELELANRVSGALAYVTGSPSEYLGESRVVLRDVAAAHELPVSIQDFASALSQEIDEGFRLVGGA